MVNLDEIAHWKLLTRPNDMPSRILITFKNSGKEVAIWDDAEDLQAKLTENYKKLTSKRQVL